MQLPKDVCMGALRVTLTGNSEVWIENYRGILEYTGERILLQARTCQVCLEEGWRGIKALAMLCGLGPHGG